MARIFFTESFLKKAMSGTTVVLDPDTAGGIKRTGATITGSANIGSPQRTGSMDEEMKGMGGIKEGALSSAAKWGLGGAALGGGALGAIGYTTPHWGPREKMQMKREMEQKGIEAGTPEHKAYLKRHKILSGLSRGLSGAITGGFLGHSLGRMHDLNWGEYSGGYSGSRSGGRSGSRTQGAPTSILLKRLGLSGKEKTKTEVAARWKNLAKQHHPDRGGSTEKMKDINNAMDDLKNSNWFNKLAHKNFFLGFFKHAADWNHAAELAGLGVLAAPSVQQLRGKPMKENTQRKFEIAGLGTLAAPSLAHFGKALLKKE